MDGLNKYVTTISIATFVPTMGTNLGMNSCTRRIYSSISNHDYEYTTSVDITSSTVVLISLRYLV